MERSTTATFIGHDDTYGLDKDRLRAEIVKLIESGYRTFISGGMGMYDRVCAGIVKDLEKEYSVVRNYLIIPYLSFNILYPGSYDEVIYPDGFERHYFKRAILERNKYLVDNSSCAICFVKHGWGGAAKTLEYAMKKELKVINLGCDNNRWEKSPRPMVGN